VLAPQSLPTREPVLLSRVKARAFKRSNTPLENPSKTAVTAVESRTKNGGAMGWQNGRTTHALKSLPDRQI
jgi:hypothetical protein